MTDQTTDKVTAKVEYTTAFWTTRCAYITVKHEDVETIRAIAGVYSASAWQNSDNTITIRIMTDDGNLSESVSGLLLAIEAINAPVPQNKFEYIDRYPRPGYEGKMGALACTLIAETRGIVYAIGDNSAWVWSEIEYRQARVLAILYAGYDRNLAIKIADRYNMTIARGQ
jgi:hypothetical protein